MPLEVTNAQGTLAAAKEVLLLLLIYVSGRRVLRPPIAFLTTPGIAFPNTYRLAFVYASASIANSGILVRQRAQLLPVFFVILAISG